MRINNWDEVIIGAPFAQYGVATGAARVYYGSGSGLGSTPTTLWGANSGDHFGYSVAGVHDSNGDLYGDVLVGAPYHDNGQTDEGKVYLFRGNSSGVSTTAAWTYEGNQAGALLGFSVAGFDISGDGIGDLAIGLPYYDYLGLTNNGVAWFFLGVSGDNPVWDSIVYGSASDGHCGGSVSMGYVNYAQKGLVVGHPDAGGGVASIWAYRLP
ncbi:MAG: FG-GAP repeat protein [Chloroflexi bacterium]|nr:FG-GAP repeat protein [Chloroflexota bacterium]